MGEAVKSPTWRGPPRKGGEADRSLLERWRKSPAEMLLWEMWTRVP